MFITSTGAGAIAKVMSANVPGTQATAEVTPGAVDNIKMLQNNSLDFAFTKSDAASEAIKGVGYYASTGKVNVRAIAVLYPDIAHVVVVPGINKLEDMKGKRISTARRAAATRWSPESYWRQLASTLSRTSSGSA